jgi:Late embryogenesis abundant protein
VIVRVSNPATNPVAAQILRMDWTLLLDGKDTVGGRLDRRYTIAPGQTVEVPVHVAVDLADVVGRHAGTLIRLGVALAEGRDGPVDLRLRVAPIVDTPLGGMRIPAFTIPLETAAR